MNAKRKLNDDEIKDILSYLFLATNLFDRNAFLRCCNTPTRGLGDTFQEEFLDFWNKFKVCQALPWFFEYISFLGEIKF